jgi:GDP-4-dehydro-6-deoxy-D-mannose reductase
MNKVLITGMGSTGTYLADYLVQEYGCEVHGTSRKLFNSKNYTIHQCDLNDFHTIYQLLKKIKPDYIFNLASNADVRFSFDSIALFENNCKICLNLLEAIKLSEIDTIIMQCSSSETYGNIVTNSPITENNIQNPANIYSISKTTQEHLCNYYYNVHKLKIIITRAFCYINPRRKNIFSSSFAKQIVNIENNKQIELLHGNLDSIRTLCNIKDICEAYWLAVTKCNVGEVYNIGSTEPISVKEFLIKIINKAKCNIPARQDNKLLRAIDVTFQIPNINKFQKQTGWSPKISLDDSIEWLLNEYRNGTS